MVRTLVFLLLGAVTLAVLATPGLAVVGILALLFLFCVAAWWVGLAVTTCGHAREVAVSRPRRRFLGPGGPDDPFVDLPYEGELQQADPLNLPPGDLGATLGQQDHPRSPEIEDSAFARKPER